MNELVAAYDRYIAVLDAELNELVPLAYAHGWRSTRYEIGKRCRADIKAAKEKMRRASHNRAKRACPKHKRIA